MPITTKSAAQPRTTLLGYLNKRGGAMPTRSEWLTILNSNVNIKEDIKLEQDDIEGLTTALENKLDADKLPNADKMFESMKEAINALIEEKVSEATKTAAQAAAAATIQLADFDTDTKPVGAICQYTGQDNATNNYYRGFFYEKVREHDPETDNQEPQPETITGEEITIQNTAKYTFGGVTYLGSFNLTDTPLSSRKVQAIVMDEKYVVFAVQKDAALQDDGNTYYFGSDAFTVYPIAININTLQLVTTEFKEAEGYTIPALYVNGVLPRNAKSTTAFYNLIFRESDNAPYFMVYYKNSSKGSAALVCPVYADRLIDTTTEEEDYFVIATTEPNPMSDEQIGANLAITPNYPVRGAEPINSLAPWKMIQVSPFCIPD